MFLLTTGGNDSAKMEAIDARIELIVDLNRRLLLLDELMIAARAKRCSNQQNDILPVVSQPA